MLPNFRKPDFDAANSGAMPLPTLSAHGGLGTPAVGTPHRGADRGAPSIIGPELIISGNLSSRGDIQVEGEVQGDIHATHVTVGERAQITGGIIADEVVVRGHVMGSIRGKRVLLQTTCHVEGDVYHQTLAIEQGAFFEGKSRRTQDPTAGFAGPERKVAVTPLAIEPEVAPPPPRAPVFEYTPPTVTRPAEALPAAEQPHHGEEHS